MIRRTAYHIAIRAAHGLGIAAGAVLDSTLPTRLRYLPYNVLAVAVYVPLRIAFVLSTRLAFRLGKTLTYEQRA